MYKKGRQKWCTFLLEATYAFRKDKGAGSGLYIVVSTRSLFSLWGFDDSGRSRWGQKGVVVVDVLVPLRNLCKARTANGAGVGGRRFVGVRTFLRPLRLAL